MTSKLSDLRKLTLIEITEQIRNRQTTPTEILTLLLEQINQTDNDLRAYTTVCAEPAIKAAEAAELQVTEGKNLGPLHGIPVSIKDLFDVQGLQTTCASKLMRGHVATRDCTAVKNLKSAGAIVLGKVNTHEFAYGGVTPPTRNPWDSSRIPGGSSGGSGAAIAVTSAIATTGSDTGGSIRIPASFCGVVGLKPTYGRVSRTGVFPLSWSMDHVGPITKRVEDAALMLTVMGGFDETDPTSSTSPVPNYVEVIHQESTKVTVGVPTNHFFDPCASDIVKTVRTAVYLLESIGCTIVEFEFPLINEITAAHNIVLSAEASACHQHWLMQKGSEFSSDVRSSLEQGLFVPAVDYINALRFRGVAFPRIVSLFKDFDVIVTPTEPFVPPMLGETVVEFGGIREDYEIANMRYLAPFNLLGLPALSLPCGFAENGLPIGMQVIGKPFDETTVLKVGYMYENSTDWHLKYPDKY